ncbi:hypothetical protein [Bartonella rattaustraliani]|uniref:hypothetical protein n=1 Tax=Bartonella rattaustraliani TaxID=481139 RepID=UPI0002F2CB8F|nr:hypothetical protein [Bartonella rattaustraliani]
MAQLRKKFATQVDSEILNHLYSLAEQEGKQIQALVDEALRDLLEKRKYERPRAQIMSAYNKSHDKYVELYQKLAK